MALSKSATNADGRKLLARVYIIRRRHDLALIETEHIIAGNPNDAEGHIEQGQVLFWMGRADGAIRALETALEFDPKLLPEAYWHLASAHYLKGNYRKAIMILERNVLRRKDFAVDQIVLAAAYSQGGDIDRAKIAAATVRRLDPFFSADKFGSQFARREDAERFIDGLRLAGL